MIDEATIWEAYRGVHRYCEAHPAAIHPSGMNAAQIKVGRKPYAMNQRRALATLVPIIAEFQQTHPIDGADDLYYAYLYLWAQMLRCSKAYGAFWEGPEWRKLTLRPLLAFANPIAGPAMWRRFYYVYIQSEGAQLGDLHAYFPWSDPLETARDAGLQRQLGILRSRMQAYGYQDPTMIFQTLSAAGYMLHTREAKPQQPWLPELIAAFPESWTPDDATGSYAQNNPAVVTYVQAMVCDKKERAIFVTQVLPLVHNTTDIDHLRQILTACVVGFDDVVSGDKWEHVYRPAILALLEETVWEASTAP